VTATFDEPDFLEHVLALPGRSAAEPDAGAVQGRPRRPAWPGHGAVGLMCDDIEASHDRALACEPSS
jgi:lactoylglutathione lyase